MTTQTFETSKGTLLVVDLPDGATGTALTSHNLHVDIDYGLGYESLTLPPGDWKEIGLWGSVSDEKAKEVVDYIPEVVGYINYDDSLSPSVDTALESLQSLLEAQIKLVNTVPKPKEHHLFGYDIDAVSEWRIAESQVWKNAFLIFKIK
ncbi:hypothetical protein ACLOAU_14545 [Niabella sp. CJ426]|uniref:hypothetical protein n=1 Tax=Niabella sp. CJ426 TaxID=3393740 RepID=UPI003CFDF7B4